MLTVSSLCIFGHELWLLTSTLAARAAADSAVLISGFRVKGLGFRVQGLGIQI